MMLEKTGSSCVAVDAVGAKTQSARAPLAWQRVEFIPACLRRKPAGCVTLLFPVCVAIVTNPPDPMMKGGG